MSDLVGNPEDRFSRVAAQLMFALKKESKSAQKAFTVSSV